MTLSMSSFHTFGKLVVVLQSVFILRPFVSSLNYYIVFFSSDKGKLKKVYPYRGQINVCKNIYIGSDPCPTRTLVIYIGVGEGKCRCRRIFRWAYKPNKQNLWMTILGFTSFTLVGGPDVYYFHIL
jgi:hypothetical protein